MSLYKAVNGVPWHLLNKVQVAAATSSTTFARESWDSIISYLARMSHGAHLEYSTIEDRKPVEPSYGGVDAV